MKQSGWNASPLVSVLQQRVDFIAGDVDIRGAVAVGKHALHELIHESTAMKSTS
jgi:hypothetical protein